tara:strand:+ start:1996 stop:2913 length:918 start_codon:yes stop_codon:yes gene_type:complete
MDYYNVLNISKDASPEGIKKAYRQLSMKYHPDRNPDPSAAIEMGKINEAYETLGDTNKRHIYDMESSLLRGGMGGGHIDMNNMMQNLFSMGSMGGFGNMSGSFGVNIGEPDIHFFNGTNLNEIFDQINKPPTLRKQIYITFDESYFGISTDIELEKWSIVNRQKIHELVKIRLHIPPGTQNHETITLEKQGHMVNDNSIGDVCITIVVKEHEYFQRENNDLVYYKTIPLKEALCGFKFEFHHLNNKTYLLNNEKNHMVIYPGFRKTVNGLGFQRNGQYGSLIIEFSVTFPENINEENIEKLKNIL